MENIFFALPGNEQLTESLLKKCGGIKGDFEFRKFPDKETYVKIITNVSKKNIFLVCTLHHPDDKLLLLYFLAKTAKDLDAGTICLVAPYLAYMRQDKRFEPGEGITSAYFAKLISSFVDSLITIDPHLHRRNSLKEIYTIPATVLHAAKIISQWINSHIENPLLIGPDSESTQWVSEIAADAGAPFIILEKTRKSDTVVEVSFPPIEKYKNYTPVLVDDIISTARTMIETIGHLKKTSLKMPVCIGVHGIFAGNAYLDLISAGTSGIVTTNSIMHESNRIKIDELLAGALNMKK